MRLVHLLAVPAVLLALVACDSPQTTDTPAEEEGYPCALTDREALAGKTFVYGTPRDNGGYDPDVRARMQFFKEGDKMKVKYTVKSLVSVYTYSCDPNDKKGGWDCRQDNPDVKEYCRSFIANTGGCTPEQLAAELKRDPADPELKKVADEVNGIYKKLSPTEVEKFKTGYNSPNTQLRGLLIIRPPKKVKKADDCALNVQDKYETFSFGSKREMENPVGSAKFIEDTKDYVWEMCTDTANLAVVDDKGQPVAEATPGQALTAKYIGKDKPEPGCTYSMDTFYNYEPVGKQVPVEGGKFEFTKSVMSKGRATMHMYRYKTCGGKPAERISVSCNSIVVP